MKNNDSDFYDFINKELGRLKKVLFEIALLSVWDDATVEGKKLSDREVRQLQGLLVSVALGLLMIGDNQFAAEIEKCRDAKYAEKYTHDISRMYKYYKSRKEELSND